MIPIRDLWGKGEGPATPQCGWDSWQAAHRQSLPLAITCLKAASVFEIGCGSGPNLRFLRERFPSLTLGGNDVRPEYVEWANEHLDAHVDVQALPAAVGPEWDVTLSCYVMAYLSAEETREQLATIKSRGLILMEPESNATFDSPVSFEVSPGVWMLPRYYHPWNLILAETEWRLTWRWPLPMIDDLRSLIICERA